MIKTPTASTSKSSSNAELVKTTTGTKTLPAVNALGLAQEAGESIQQLPVQRKTVQFSVSPIIQRALIEGVEIKNPRDFMIKYRQHPKVGAWCEVIRNNEEKHDALKEVLRKSQEFNSPEEVMAAVESQFTADRAQAALPAAATAGGEEGPLNVKGTGPVSNLTRGAGDGYFAGSGESWHIHYNHIKFGKSGESRVNIYQESTASGVLDEIRRKSLGIELSGPNWDACVKWLRDHLQP